MLFYFTCRSNKELLDICPWKNKAPWSRCTFKTHTYGTGFTISQAEQYSALQMAPAVTTELFNSQQWQRSEEDKVRLYKEQHKALEQKLGFQLTPLCNLNVI